MINRVSVIARADELPIVPVDAATIVKVYSAYRGLIQKSSDLG